LLLFIFVVKKGAVSFSEQGFPKHKFRKIMFPKIMASPAGLDQIKLANNKKNGEMCSRKSHLGSTGREKTRKVQVLSVQESRFLGLPHQHEFVCLNPLQDLSSSHF